jgi:hypothetical protein
MLSWVPSWVCHDGSKGEIGEEVTQPKRSSEDGSLIIEVRQNGRSKVKPTTILAMEKLGEKSIEERRMAEARRRGWGGGGG